FYQRGIHLSESQHVRSQPPAGRYHYSRESQARTQGVRHFLLLWRRLEDRAKPDFEPRCYLFLLRAAIQPTSRSCRETAAGPESFVGQDTAPIGHDACHCFLFHQGSWAEYRLRVLSAVGRLRNRSWEDHAPRRVPSLL